jgi:hypothetical protein
MQRAMIPLALLICGIGAVTWLFVGPRWGIERVSSKVEKGSSSSINPVPSFVAPGPSRQVESARMEIRGAALGGAPVNWVQAAEAYLERAYQEEIFAERARHDGDQAEARKHDQRSADYLMAARFYVHQGHEPRGFDADLATK